MVDLEELKEQFKKAEITNTEDITLRTKIFYDLNIDSIAIMQIICELETTYDVTFNENQLNFEENMDVNGFLKILNEIIA